MLVAGLQIALLVYPIRKSKGKCAISILENVCVGKFGDVSQIFLTKKSMVYCCDLKAKL